MQSSTCRTALRSARAARSIRTTRHAHIRFQSTEPAVQAAKSQTPAIVAGIAGGSFVFLAGYGWYHMSGAKTLVNTAQQTKTYFDQTFRKSVEAAPAPDQAVQWLRDTVSGYTKFVPGAQGYVDQAFADLEKVQKNHGDEVNDIITKTYSELKEVTKGGATFAAAGAAWDVLQRCLKRIGDLAGDAAGDVLENHPELKDKVGGKIDQLKQMGEQYGPEAKKQAEDTWNQIQDILKGGVSADTAGKVQKLVQEKSEQMKKYGDQAWQKGMDEAKPLLDKQPELKEMVNKNKEKLLQGDLGQLWTQLKEASKSGNTEELQKFVKGQVDKAQAGASGGMDQLFKMIPGGEEILPKLQQLQELSQKHGKEAEKLVKSAIDDIKQVLQRKVEEGQKLKQKLEKDVKS